MNRVAISTVFVLSIGTGSCVYLDRNYQCVVRESRSSTVHVASDSQEIRGILSEAETRDATWKPLSMPFGIRRDGYERFRKEYMPQRRGLIEAMDRSPGFDVAGGSYCRILEKSSAQCETEPAFYSTTYVKVRVSTGAAEGKEGWLCRGKVPNAADYP